MKDPSATIEPGPDTAGRIDAAARQLPDSSQGRAYRYLKMKSFMVTPESEPIVDQTVHRRD